MKFSRIAGLGALGLFCQLMPAQADNSETRVLFILGSTDASVKSGSSFLNNPRDTGSTDHGEIVLIISGLKEGRGPINGKFDLGPSSSNPELNAQFRILPNGKPQNQIAFLHPEDDRVTEMSLTYENSKITGFTVKMDPLEVTDGTCQIGFHSLSGTQDGVELVFKEEHGDGLCRNTDLTDGPSFGQGVFRFDENARHVAAEEEYSVSPGPRCYWMENHTKQYIWIDATQGDISLAECKALDSCDRIDDETGTSGGGCYKYASESFAPGVAWPTE